MMRHGITLNNLKRLLFCFAVAALVSLRPSPAGAETLVLIPGFLDDGGNWRDSGITDILHRGGWLDAGHLRWQANRVDRSLGHAFPSNKRFYTVDLPTVAPLPVQKRYLAAYIGYLGTAYAGESLILVGHSAGGVLGRLFMVEHPESPVSALITIASPHLGTGLAQLGLFAADSPLGMIGPMFGNRFDPHGLLQDLAPERQGSLLFWLNRQPHPEARYLSVVRKKDDLFGLGDMVVPPGSQDMNNVMALRGRVYTLVFGNSHGLTKEDGGLLLRMLTRLLMRA